MPRSLRIATVCFSGQVGGLELAPLRRGAELRAHGHEVVAVLPNAPDLIMHAHRLELPVEIVEPTLSYADPLAALRLRAIFRRRHIDVAIVARTRDLSTTMIAAGARTAVVLYQQMQSGLDKRDWFHNRVYRRLDGCITITAKGRDEMTRCTVLAPEKISVIPYGIDTERFSPDALARDEARATFQLPAEGFIVGIIGGFDPAKGQKEFLEAMRIAGSADPEFARQAHALLVGMRPTDNPAYIAELTALKDALPFPEQAQLHPFSLDPRPAYRAMDVFVLASHSETFGMVLQEALAMGLPSIGTDSGGVPEIVTDAVTGLLVPPRDPSAIAAALLRLFREPELRNRLSKNARESVLERYDRERQYRAFEGALMRAVGSRAGRQIFGYNFIIA